MCLNYSSIIRRSATSAFRTQIIAAKPSNIPVVHIDNTSFMYTRVNDVYVVAATKHNINTALVFQVSFFMHLCVLIWLD